MPGGIAPGSMPPMSKTLEQEGAAIIAFKLVEKGVFQEQGEAFYVYVTTYMFHTNSIFLPQGISDLLRAPGSISGNFGTRNLADNLSDLKAQVNFDFSKVYSILLHIFICK